MIDTLGDRMKLFESAEAGRRFMPLLPILTRIDGRCFSKFTKGMNRPYDREMSQSMINTTKALVEETGACMGYTQSDEITLAWHQTDMKSEIWFGGRVQKMVSQLAAQTTLHFNKAIESLLPDYIDRLPTFDARCWQVPNREEAANAFLWREWDATKNSITMAAHEHYSHKELHGKHGGEQLDMLHAKGIQWEGYPAFFKRGTYVQRRKVFTAFTQDEIDSLPPLHQARTNPALTVERHEIRVLDLPPLSKIVNRVDVIFEGATPLRQLDETEREAMDKAFWKSVEVIDEGYEDYEK